LALANLRIARTSDPKFVGKKYFCNYANGGGNLCYQLPALTREGTAIVVSPLIALMKNQVDAIRVCLQKMELRMY
jgi:ATP-dependent helicase YprA (DUF1998 family)